jgi:hypothetical protein
MPSHDHLARLARRWRALPPYGRLRSIVRPEPGKLQIAEMRAFPYRLTLPGWDQGEDELAVAVVLRIVVIRPPTTFIDNETIVAVAGLHALARRFERGAPRTDAAVMRDLTTCGAAWRDTVTAGGEFALPASAGRWRGAVMATEAGAPLLAVRTYLA